MVMSSSDATKAIILSFFQAIRRRDRDGLRDLLAEEVTLTNPITEEVIRGSDAVVSALWAVVSAFPDLDPQVTSLFSEGPDGVAETVRTGTHSAELKLPGLTVPATGRKIRLPECVIFHLEGGKIAAMRAYIDRLAASEQLGFER